MSELPEEDPGDPGWGGAGLVLLVLLAPWLGLLLMFLVFARMRRAGKGTSVLAMLRQVMLAFAAALVSFLVVLTLMDLDVDDPPVSPAVAALGVLAYGFAGQLATWRIEQELNCEDVGALLGTYRARFFLRLAFADSSALLGFVGAFVTGSLLPYLAGLIPAAMGFARAAPTRANLMRDDERLRDRGCPHSVYAWLRTATVGQPGSQP